MVDRKMVIARTDEDLKKRLAHALVDEGISFSEWLRRQIEGYVARKESKLGNKRGSKKTK